MHKDNETNYVLCKAELLIWSRMSHYTLEERGLNTQHFEETNNNFNSGSSDSESVSSVEEIIGQSNTRPNSVSDTRSNLEDY